MKVHKRYKTTIQRKCRECGKEFRPISKGNKLCEDCIYKKIYKEK